MIDCLPSWWYFDGFGCFDGFLSGYRTEDYPNIPYYNYLFHQFFDLCNVVKLHSVGHVVFSNVVK